MNDFIKLTKTELRQNTGIAVLTFLFIFFSRFITFVSALNNAVDDVKADFADMDYTADIAAENIGSVNFSHIAAVILLAGIFGLIVCRYLHRRKTIDFYYSLPYKRTTVFAAKYSSFIIIFAICYGFNLLLMLMACKGISIRAFTAEVVVSGLRGLFNGIFGFTLIYSSVVLAGLLTGGILAHIALASLFMYIVPLTYALINNWSGIFFTTYLTWSWSEIYNFISPISWFCGMADSETAGIISMAVISVVITIINFVICKKRKAESAGSVLIFYGEPLRLFLSLVIAAGGGFTAWLFFGYSYISFTVGFFAALIISSVIIEIIFSADFGAALKHKRWLGASVLTGAVILIYTFSGLYDSYLPKASLIKEAAFYIDEIHYDELITTKEDKNYLADNADETFMKDYNGETVFSYISDDDIFTTFRREKYTDYVFKNMKITDGELAEKVLSACVEKYHNEDIGYLKNTVSIYVKCRLKSGRSYTRRYIVNIDDCREALGELFASEEYKKSLYESFYNLENEDIKALRIDNSFCWHGEQRVNIAEEQWQRLYAAVCEDTANLTFEEVITDVPLCAVSFYTRETDGGFYEDYFEGAMMYIYPSYEKTIECLKEVGFKTYTSDELAEHITRINNITDKEAIKEILPYIYEDYVLERTEILYTSAKDISVSVYTKDSKDEDGHYEARLFYNYTDLPDNVKKYF